MKTSLISESIYRRMNKVTFIVTRPLELHIRGPAVFTSFRAPLCVTQNKSSLDPPLYLKSHFLSQSHKAIWFKMHMQYCVHYIKANKKMLNNMKQCKYLHQVIGSFIKSYRAWVIEDRTSKDTFPLEVILLRDYCYIMLPNAPSHFHPSMNSNHCSVVNIFQGGGTLWRKWSKWYKEV